MAKASGTALYYQYFAYVLFRCEICIYNCIFKKGAQERDIRLRVFLYIIQVCMGRWLKKYRKNKNYFGLGLFSRKFLLSYDACALLVIFNL